MFITTEEDKRYINGLIKRLDRAFFKMQYEYSKDVLKAALKNPAVITPDEIDEHIKICLQFHGGRCNGKRLYLTRLAVAAEIQRNREGGKLWPFIVIKRSTK